jgi:hypothetical protein
MREETKRRLEQVLWRERAKKVALAAAALGAVGLVFVYEDYETQVENIRVPGTVLSVGPVHARNTMLIQNDLSVDVALENGRHVRVLALKSTDPHVGDHVQITEHRHRTGRVTYSWN